MLMRWGPVRVTTAVSFIVIVAIVLFAFSEKVFARSSHGGPRGPARLAIAARKAQAPPAEPPADAGAVAPAAQLAVEPAQHAADDETEAHVRSAKVGPDGGVPSHEKGEFRSPFANPEHGKTKVKVGFLLESIEGYDIKTGAFIAHFYLTLTSERPMPNVTLQATNGKLESRELLANHPTFKMWKFAGAFTEPPDLRLYPFDTQELTIELEDDSNGADAMELVPDPERTTVDAGFEIPGWDDIFIRAQILKHYYPDRFENDDLYYARYKVTLGIKRYATNAIFTVFVPALVIVVISLSGLWFPRDKIEIRTGSTTPMLAAAVFFHFALTQSLPATAYLTRADKLMVAVYACLFLHMLSSWLWFMFHEKHTDTIFRLAKYSSIPITFGVMALGILV